MRGRGKREDDEYNNSDYLGDNIPESSCKKHPNSSSSAGGICAYCLTDKLAELVCPQCGEQRFPSCSCSEVCNDPNWSSSTTVDPGRKSCSYPNWSSSTTVDTGRKSCSYPNWSSSTTADVSRISFLLDNDKQGAEIPSSKTKIDKRSTHYEDYSNLQRSNSISAPRSSASETGKFWKFGKLFRKKRDKSNCSKSNQYQINEESNNNNNNNNNGFKGFTRSRSVCNYGRFYDPEEIGNFPLSSSAARASSVSTGNFVLESAKMSCFSESEARFSNFEARSSNFDYCDASNFVGPNRNTNIFSSQRETEFVSSDDQAYFDLKLNDMSSSSSDYSSKVPPDLAAMKRTGFGLSTREFGFRGGGGDVYGHDMYNGGRSCRMSSVSDRDFRKSKKSYKVWKWFSKQHTSSGKFDDYNDAFN